MSETVDFATIAAKMFELYRTGEYGQALEYVEKNMAFYPEQGARITFWRICLLSLCGRSDDALSVLAKGLDAGHWWHESQFRDTDLDSIRDLPKFKELVTRSHERWIQAGTSVKPDRTLLIPAGSGPYPLLIALHGYSGDKDSNLKYWEIARRKGWLVLSPQSRQPLYPGAYYWDSPQAGIEEILFHLDEIQHTYRIDAHRVIVAGMSQGGGLAALAGLYPKINAAGSICLAAWWDGEKMEAFKAAVKQDSIGRAYFITGLKDQTLDRSREIQGMLKEAGVSVEEEVHPDLGHEFPPDFRKSFEEALKFLFS